MRHFAVIALVLALAGAAAPVQAAPEASKPQRLQRFSSCADLLGYARTHGTRTVGPWGFGGPAVTAVLAPVAAGAERAAAPASDTDFSGTNVQEEGVDEPDLVKTDGRRILAVAGGRLRLVDVTGARPRLRDSLALPEAYAHDVLVEGDRALVISRNDGAIALPVVRIGPTYEAKTILTEVEVREGQLRVADTLTVDGGYLSARKTGSTVRLVVRTFPEVKFEQPTDGTPEQQRAAEARNERAVAASKISSWLPRYELRRKGGGVTRRFLSNCRSVGHPVRFSGLGMVTVLTLDLSKGIKPVDSDALMSNGEIVYASTESLYVATQTWIDPETVTEKNEPPKVETALHAFDAPAAPRTSYRASGNVNGYLLNQWSLSEHRGAIRVASTTMPLWWPSPNEQREESESFVTVLEPRAGKLLQVGRVGGLGRDERIFGVRFVGDVGYVVTFRQVDPLYTLDLANHERPTVRGELKIQGYSAYLHPVGEDLLLGVGQDATAEGRTLGTQVSLFDVSDLRKPTRLDRLAIEGGSSEAEFDHHAFLYWPKKRLVVIPLQTYPQRGGEVTVGALGVNVSRARGVARSGTLEHDTTAPIRRSLVVRDTLYTMSDVGLKASDVDSFADRAWVAFPAKS